jgi:parvulin-like peptidyl-prolyl isomerase
MKTGIAAKTIITVIFLLALSAVQASELKTLRADTGPAITEGASSAEKIDKEAAETVVPGEEKKKAAAEGPMITMKDGSSIPLFSPKFAKTPIAAVNDENIVVEDLLAAIGSMHEDMQEQTTSKRKNYSEVLNRLITMKLMVQEARNMELDQLKEVSSLVNEFEKTSLREQLLVPIVKDLKADATEVENIYREMVREWKIKSIRFKKAADAKKMARKVKAGKSFDELVAKAVTAGLAEGSKDAAFYPAQGLDPLIARAVAVMKVGSVSPVIKVESGFALVSLEEVRYPDNPEARKQAETTVLNNARKTALESYRDQLVKKYVKMNTQLFKKIDFEAPKPGFKKLLDDKRAIAEITGENPITVAELAKTIQGRFFHGVERAIQEKKVNILKTELLEVLLQRRIFEKEARVQGIDKSDEYRDKIGRYKDSVYFGIFMEKAIRKDVKVTEAELTAYYRDHLKDFAYPEMIRMNGLAFTSQESAQAAIDKLRQGVDFKWLKETAEGQVVGGDSATLLTFDGKPVATTSLPDDLRKALTGVHSGDFRLYPDAAKHYYALHITDVVPPREKPYLEVRDEIGNAVFQENLQKTFDEWAGKLREASEIKTFADFGEIR